MDGEGENKPVKKVRWREGSERGKNERKGGVRKEVASGKGCGQKALYCGKFGPRTSKWSEHSKRTSPSKGGEGKRYRTGLRSKRAGEVKARTVFLGKVSRD